MLTGPTMASRQSHPRASKGPPLILRNPFVCSGFRPRGSRGRSSEVAQWCPTGVLGGRRNRAALRGRTTPARRIERALYAFAAVEDPAGLQAIWTVWDRRRFRRRGTSGRCCCPNPFCDADRRYQLSIVQAEFSLTQLLDTPINDRVFFEQVIRDNLDVGRSDRVSLIFDRKGARRGRDVTPGRFRTDHRRTLGWVVGVCGTRGRPFLMRSPQLDPPVRSRSARTRRGPERRR